MTPIIRAMRPDTDLHHMQRALALAEQALWLTSPNPRVGCVLVSPEGQVLGEGHTQRAGQAHVRMVVAVHIARLHDEHEGQQHNQHADGRAQSVQLILRLDTQAEIEYVKRGGILPYVLRQLAAKKK